jgi:hypothetical protein
MEEVNQYYRNSKLFSRDFLEKHLPKLPEWQIPEDDLEEALEKLQNLFQRALPATSEAALEEELIRPILGEVLGFSYLVQPSAAVFKTHRQPDYALYASEEEKLAAKTFDGQKQLFEDALAVADAKAWDVNLDAVGPASQMHDYILLSGVRWGLITNGRRWRLYHRDTVHELDTFYEVDLDNFLKLKDPKSLKYFILFFRAESFRAGGFLDRVLTQSVEYAQRVGAELKENVYDALRFLCQGFLDSNSQLSPEDLAEIHENALILLYRILFLLYAESERERELLPLSNADYRERIGLCALKRDVANRQDWLTETHTLWGRLADLFRLINRGSESLGICAYNGGLFDSQLHPLLERWQIGDRYLAEAFRLLSCTEAEGRRGFLDYSALDVRELGSIYEGLLEHKLILKDGELEWEKDRSQRKKTGSYYTPEYIVQYIVEQTIGPLIDEIQSGLKTDLDERAEKIRRARGENRKLLEEKKGKLLRDARERVFDLKILDPAMGSGHFLVTACDYVARRIAELEAELTNEETEEAVQALKRTVAERCLYGVDLNPLATELAKLSLWLHTVAKDRPLSFLNHHLRTGNSLIGAWVKYLGTLPVLKKRKKAGTAGQTGLFEGELKKRLPVVIGHVVKLLRTPSDKVEQIREKERIYNKIREVLWPFKEVANVWASVYFGNEVEAKDYEEKLLFKLSDPSAVWEGEVRSQPWFAKAQAITKGKHFFHWELEFPEVFYRETGQRKENPGFDAVIGNPPYGANISKNEDIYLRNHFTCLGKELESYAVFSEQGCKLLRIGGSIALITASTYLVMPYFRALRDLFLEKYTLEKLILFRFSVFKGAVVETTIFVVRKLPPGDEAIGLSVLNEPLLDLYKIHPVSTPRTQFLENPGHELNILATKEQRKTLAKVRRNSFKLKEKYEVRSGIMTSGKSLIVDSSQHPKARHLIYGEHICRYQITSSGLWIIYDLELAKEHKYALREERIFEECPKLIIRQTADRPIVALDQDRWYSLKNTHVIIPKKDAYLSLSYVCAVLNSKLLQFVYQTTIPEAGRTFAEMKLIYVESFPIRRIAFTTPKDERARLVEEGKRLYFEALEKLGLKVEK